MFPGKKILETDAAVLLSHKHPLVIDFVKFLAMKVDRIEASVQIGQLVKVLLIDNALRFTNSSSISVVDTVMSFSTWPILIINFSSSFYTR